MLLLSDKNIGLRFSQISASQKSSLTKLSTLLRMDVWRLDLKTINDVKYDDIYQKRSINLSFFNDLGDLVDLANATLKKNNFDIELLLKDQNGLFMLIQKKIKKEHIDLVNQTFTDDIVFYINKLSHEDAQIVCGRFGFNGEAEPLQSLAKRIGLAASRIRQKETEICTELKCKNRVSMDCFASITDKTLLKRLTVLRKHFCDDAHYEKFVEKLLEVQYQKNELNLDYLKV